MLLTLPNILTYSRVLAVPLLVAALYWGGEDGRWVAFGVFAFASLTDFFDGWLARRWNQQSEMGRMLDPIADKLLVGAALMMLVYTGTISGWHVFAAILILCREILVSGLREYLAATQVSLQVTWLAKWKTTVQMLAIGILLAGPAAELVIPGSIVFGLMGLWVAALLTLVTGYDYLKSGLAHIFAADQ